MASRPLKDSVTRGWRELAALFENLLGGSANTRQAAAYLRGLAGNNLPVHPLHPLPWLEEHVNEQVAVQVRMEPHPCVLAVLSPSVPLRAVWRRGRWTCTKRFIYLNHCIVIFVWRSRWLHTKCFLYVNHGNHVYTSVCKSQWRVMTCVFVCMGLTGNLKGVWRTLRVANLKGWFSLRLGSWKNNWIDTTHEELCCQFGKWVMHASYFTKSLEMECELFQPEVKKAERSYLEKP